MNAATKYSQIEKGLLVFSAFPGNVLEMFRIWGKARKKQEYPLHDKHANSQRQSAQNSIRKFSEGGTAVGRQGRKEGKLIVR